MRTIEQRFTVSYAYPVIFLRDLFAPECEVLAELLARDPTSPAPHRVFAALALVGLRCAGAYATVTPMKRYRSLFVFCLSVALAPLVWAQANYAFRGQFVRNYAGQLTSEPVAYADGTACAGEVLAFLYVVPAARHLWELKEVLYDAPYPNEEKETPYEGFTYREIVPVDREKIEVISAQARHDRKEAARLRNELIEREKRLDPPPSRRLFDALFRDGDIAVTEKYLAAGIWSLRSGAEGDLARWFERQTGNYLAPPGSFSVKSTALLEEAGVRLDEADAMLLAQWATDVDPSRRGLAIGVLEQLLKLKTSRRCAPGAAVAAVESVRRQCMENPEFFVADSMMETDLRQLFVLLRSAECADGVDAVVVPAENTALKTLREIIAVTRPGN